MNRRRLGTFAALAGAVLLAIVTLIILIQTTNNNRRTRGLASVDWLDPVGYIPAIVIGVLVVVGFTISERAARRGK